MTKDILSFLVHYTDIWTEDEFDKNFNILLWS